MYRDHLLPISETFIKAQGESLTSYNIHYVGSRIIDNGIMLPQEKVTVINQGTYYGYLVEYLFKKLGFSPLFTKRLKRLKPVLIHAQFGIGGALALPLKKGLNIPLVTTFHGFDITVKDEFAKKSFLGHRVYLQRRNQLINEGDAFIAVSKFIKQQLIEKGFPENKIIAHYVGIDTDEFKPDLKKERKPVVLFVGRLVEKKGCEYLLRAMLKVQQILPKTQLIIIGDGKLRSPLERMAKQLLINVQFLGAQPNTKVKEWMNKAQVFCVPSIRAESGDSEAFGIVFAEAQAMGLPVVSHYHGGIPEVVKHGETCFLVQEKDIEGLAYYLIKLLQENEINIF
jgi:glycosyltransferase involved in cell wall biosynthesis